MVLLVLRAVSPPEDLPDVALGQQERVADELLAVDAGHLAVVESVLVPIQLALDSAELEVALAQVPQLEYLLRDAQLLRLLDLRGSH